MPMPGDCGRWRDLMRRQVLGACSRDQDLQGDSGGSLGLGRCPKISRWRCLRAEQRAPRAAASPAAAAATCVLGGFVLFLNSRGFLVPFCGCFSLSSRSLVCFPFEGGRATVGLMTLWPVDSGSLRGCDSASFDMWSPHTQCRKLRQWVNVASCDNGSSMSQVATMGQCRKLRQWANVASCDNGPMSQVATMGQCRKL